MFWWLRYACLFLNVWDFIFTVKCFGTVKQCDKAETLLFYDNWDIYYKWGIFTVSLFWWYTLYFDFNIWIWEHVAQASKQPANRIKKLSVQYSEMKTKEAIAKHKPFCVLTQPNQCKQSKYISSSPPVKNLAKRRMWLGQSRQFWVFFMS